MQTAWNQSLPMGEPQEQGGLLLRNKDGSLKWQPTAAGEGGKIQLNYEEVNRHQSILAGGHTHPYGKEEGDVTDVPFSGDDLAERVFGSPRLSIVQSGEGIFGSARTKEFDDMVEARDQKGQEALSMEIAQLWNNLYKNGKGNTSERADAATRATSEQFHLLYYAGRKGKLDRVNTTPPSKTDSPNEHAPRPVK